MIAVGPDAYKKFLAQLDARPRPNARLRKSMRALAPSDKTWRSARPGFWRIIMMSPDSAAASPDAMSG